MATITGSTTTTSGRCSSRKVATASTISAVPSIPVLTASILTSSLTAASCWTRKSVGGVWMARTPSVFWATKEVTTAIAYPPAAMIDLVSAAVPAPPDGSVPAIDRTRGIVPRSASASLMVISDIPSPVRTRSGSTGVISAPPRRTPCPWASMPPHHDVRSAAEN